MVRTAKAKPRAGVTSFRSIPNVGPATEGDFRRLGITEPAQLAGRDPLKMYRELERLEGVRMDPCVLDVFMAAVDYMGGARARPWWDYTARRKRLLSGATPKARRGGARG